MRAVTRHARVIGPQVLLTVLFAVPILLAAALSDRDFTASQLWALVCMGFLMSWWIVYFTSRRFRLPTLRTFLDDRSVFRASAPTSEEAAPGEPSPQGGEHPADDPLLTKAAFSVGAQGIFIAIIALFLETVLGDSTRTSLYHETVRFLVVAIGLLTILAMIFSIDILDTATNYFRRGRRSPEGYRLYFYRTVGPLWPRGGQSYAYFGYASFGVFIVLAMAYFYPAVAGVGIAIYVYLGYPVFFGYRRCEDGAVEVDETVRIVSVVYGAALLAATIAMQVL